MIRRRCIRQASSAPSLAENIVCSILQPSEDEEKLVAKARAWSQITDLLILDWLLFGDDAKTVDMIKTIAESNEGRLNAIVVFTGASSLSNVVERLKVDAGFEESGYFVLRRDSTVVLVFGKPGITLTDGEDSRTTDYADLPVRICEDIEMLFQGLMPEFAFSGINAIRESAPRVLAALSADLDPGALTHRALLPNPDDAALQFIRLMSSNLEQALHDSQATDVWNIDAACDPLKQAMASGDPKALAARLRRSPKPNADLQKLSDDELARTAIASGLSSIGLGDSAITEAVDDLTVAFGDAANSKESLAILMSACDFSPVPPRLELGTVLRDGDGNYWVCIQPLCDSVRLKEPRAFPLLPIIVNTAKPEAMIRSPDGDAIGIGFDWSFFKLAMPMFEPTGKVVAAQQDKSGWIFTDADQNPYRAVTRLRPEIAARAAHGLASAASRAGVDAPEWLRRLA